MIKVGKKGKVEVNWNVNLYDYSVEAKNSMVSKVCAKYGIDKNQVKINPIIQNKDENGNDVSIATDTIQNIQNTDFQLKLFKEYLQSNGIEDYDFNLIKRIDASINEEIDYDVYDKYRRYSIKWVRWDNFLSYGKDNFFDFSNLKGLVLLNGYPANQSGKTTFAIDLVHFLLFGKTAKSAVQSKIFNKHLPDSTEVYVEGCVTIDGQDFVIKRTLNRPQKSKRTDKSKTTQKVEYYKVIGNDLTQLPDYVENQQGENNLQTNKYIQDAIGKEEDFDLIISITSRNLDDLIEKKDTERGKLLSRWIGLLPIEKKDEIARKKYNSDIKNSYLMNQTIVGDPMGRKYNTEDLNSLMIAKEDENELMKKEIEKIKKDDEHAKKEIEDIDKSNEMLSLKRKNVDDSLMSIDIESHKNKITLKTEEGVKCSSMVKKYEEEQASLKNSIASLEEKYSITSKDECESKRNTILDESRNISHLNGKTEAEINALDSLLSDLKKGEFCPVYKIKCDKVNNESKIKEKEKEKEELIKKLEESKKMLSEKKKNYLSINELYEAYSAKSKVDLKISSEKAKLENTRLQYKELIRIRKEYEKNEEAIRENNKIKSQIDINNVMKASKNEEVKNNLKMITQKTEKIKYNDILIEDFGKKIKQLVEESILDKNWKIYLDMIGKNGISKMVTRKTLPIINANISYLLNDVCDFDVEIGMTDKQEVMFYIIKDGVRSDIESGSGFEKTAASLAIRNVLAGISTIPKCNFVICDEILGRVARENYPNIKKLYEKMLDNYDFIIQISFIDEIKEWHDTIITVVKKDNISKLNVSAVN